MGQAVSTGLAVIGTAEINVRNRRGQLTIGIALRSNYRDGLWLMMYSEGLNT